MTTVPIKIDIPTYRLTYDQECSLVEDLEDYRYETFRKEDEWMSLDDMRSAVTIKTINVNNTSWETEDVPYGLIQIRGYCSEDFWEGLEEVYDNYSVDAVDYGFLLLQARDRYIYYLMGMKVYDI